MMPTLRRVQFLLPLCALMTIPSATAESLVKVVSSVPAVHSLMLQLVSDVGAEASLLLEDGDTLHEFNLTASKLRMLAEADLLVIVGTDEPDILDSEELSELRNGTQGVIRLAESLPEDMLLHAGHCEDHDDEDGHEDLSCVDPHLWLSTDNAAEILRVMANGLTKIDPSNKVAYQTNLEMALRRLRRLELKLGETLDTASPMQAVVWHNAYGYFARRDDTPEFFDGGMSDIHSSSISGVRLTKMREHLGSKRPGCVIFGSQEAQREHSGSFAGMPDTKTVVAVPIGPIAGVNKNSYEELMLKVATAFASCR